MTIKNIIFDFGGVLIDWNPRHLYRELFDDEAEMEWFLSHICTDEWNQMQDAGRSLLEGTAILQKQFPQYKSMIGCFYGQWEKMVKGEIRENINLLPKLKDNYRLFGLTNWSMETYPIVLERFSFFDEFDGIVISGEERMAKPGKEIFYLLLKRYDLKPGESLFIDDNAKNIKTAQEIGLHTIHYEQDLNLQSELKRLGIKISREKL